MGQKKDKTGKLEQHYPVGPESASGPALPSPPQTPSAGSASDTLLRAAGEYLEQNGWSVIVVSAERIQRSTRPDLHPDSYEFVLRFTGRPKSAARTTSPPATTSTPGLTDTLQVQKGKTDEG
jgi:hypothetical protein